MSRIFTFFFFCYACVLEHSFDAFARRLLVHRLKRTSNLGVFERENLSEATVHSQESVRTQVPVLGRFTQCIRNFTMSAAKTVPVPFLKGLFRTEAFQEGLLDFLQGSPFFEKLAAEADVMTAMMCGMHLEATVEVGKIVETTQGVFFRRFQCCAACKERLTHVIQNSSTPHNSTNETEMSYIGKTVRAVSQGISSAAAAAIRTFIDMGELMADPKLRGVLFSELANSPAVRKASTPERWLTILGTDKESKARMVMVPKALKLDKYKKAMGKGVGAAITAVTWKKNKEQLENEHKRRWQEEPIEDLDEETRNRILQFTCDSSRIASFVEWSMTSLLESIMETLQIEGSKEESAILQDPVWAEVVNALFSLLEMNAKATKANLPASIKSMSVVEMTPKEVDVRSSKWGTMQCFSQVAKAKRETTQSKC